MLRVCVCMHGDQGCGHLKPAEDLSTEAFVSTLRRFMARRNVPENIYSDNGTNFQGARNHFEELSDLLAVYGRLRLNNLSTI